MFGKIKLKNIRIGGNRILFPFLAILILVCLYRVSFFLGYFSIAQVGNILTITFGVSAGILSLIGLVSIYVSLTSQQLVQKGKDLLVYFMELPTRTFPLEPAVYSQIRMKIYQYDKVLTEPQKQLELSIAIACTSILFIVVTWISTLLFIYKLLACQEFIFVATVLGLGVLILFSFCYLLLKLKDIKSLGNFPDFSDILDGNFENKEILTPAFAALTTEVAITRSETGKHTISAYSFLAFFNCTLMLRVITDEKEKIFNSSINYDIPGPYFKGTGSSELHFDYFGALTTFNVIIHFESKQGWASASYIFKPEDFKLDNAKKYSLKKYPDLVDHLHVEGDLHTYLRFHY